MFQPSLRQCLDNEYRVLKNKGPCKPTMIKTHKQIKLLHAVPYGTSAMKKTKVSMKEKVKVNINFLRKNFRR